MVSFEFDEEAGAVYDGDLRYVLLRPDVLMGVAAKFGMEAFVEAIEESAFLNARESFSTYRAQGRLDADHFLESTGTFAARLGWGAWSISQCDGPGIEVAVRNSPFAAGAGHSPVPVCGPISGVLRALHLIALGRDVGVEEMACAAQGASCCRFRILSDPGPRD